MTDTTLDMRILELMSSKVCHDLISPIGAVNNGIEFMQEMGAGGGDEATALIAYSAEQASAKLQVYRMAYGAGGADSNVKPDDVKKAIDGMIVADGKITQDWDSAQPFGMPEGEFERTPAYSKILICAILLIIDSLPKGGSISAEWDGKTTTITGTGENAAFRDLIPQSLAQKTDNSVLEPKHIHATLTGMIAVHYGYGIDCDSGDGTVSLSFSYP